MRIGMVVASLAHRSGGLATSVDGLTRAVAKLPSFTMNLFSIGGAANTEFAMASRDVTTKFAPLIGPHALGFAPQLAAALVESQLDVVHTHGLWTYCSIATTTWSKAIKRPFLVAPHGMLDPWALQQSKWRKYVAYAVYEKAHLKRAACLHALCEAEARAIRDLGLKNPVCVVPNGVDLPAISDDGRDSSVDERISPDTRVLLYLGRLHPKKNLASLVRAWLRLTQRMGYVRTRWCLAIAGWGEDSYGDELQRLVVEAAQTDRRLASTVVFVGPLLGREKHAYYRRADGFVLPSLSEGLPMTVLEAWSYRLPVLMTEACNLPEGFARGAAIRLPTDECGMSNSLERFLQADATMRKAMGEAGRRLVEQHFTWTRVADKMSDVYKWLTSGGAPPNVIV